MAQYRVTAGCGHTTTVQLYGPGRERERRLAWMRSAGGMCNPCYAAAKRAEEATRLPTLREALARAGIVTQEQLTALLPADLSLAERRDPHAARVVAALRAAGVPEWS